MSEVAGDEKPQQDIPDPDEMFCPHCGEITPKGGTICGHCGGPLHADGQQRVPPAKWESWGKNSAGLSYLLTPLIFAPVAFYCGHKLRRYDEEAGMRIIGYAIGSVLLWIVLIQILY